ncbi:hypothetical protein N0V84_008804 [Fusarium piperis]|uniref:Uncharacterized protein n=1 Tax=Fusarium piperis TaxID=1435070 RepID=A0A9W9BJ90_9HYPO|nr:hypothetical protein N0V84_008804 [Fusarium piperis]
MLLLQSHYPFPRKESSSTALGKRPRTDFDEDDIKSICMKVLEEHLAKQRKRAREDLEDLEARIKERAQDLEESETRLKDSARKDLENLETRIKDSARKDLEDLETRIKDSAWDDLEDLKRRIMRYTNRRLTSLGRLDTYGTDDINGLMKENEDWTECKIEDGMERAKEEIYEHVEDELNKAEDRVLDRLSSAQWVLDRGST